MKARLRLRRFAIVLFLVVVSLPRSAAASDARCLLAAVRLNGIALNETRTNVKKRLGKPDAELANALEYRHLGVGFLDVVFRGGRVAEISPGSVLGVDGKILLEVGATRSSVCGVLGYPGHGGGGDSKGEFTHFTYCESDIKLFVYFHNNIVSAFALRKGVLPVEGTATFPGSRKGRPSMIEGHSRRSLP